MPVLPLLAITGTVINRKEIGRPDPDIEEFVLELRGVRPKAHAVSDHVEDPEQVPATGERYGRWKHCWRKLPAMLKA